MVDLGHEVVEFDYDLNPLLRHADMERPDHRAFVEANRPLAEAALLKQTTAAHQQGPIDLFFSYFYSVCAQPSTIRQIGEMGIRTMNWYCNGSYQFDLVEEIAPAYDWSLVPEAFRLDDYRRVGANPIGTHCQEAANPLVYHPMPVARDLDVVFVGLHTENARHTSVALLTPWYFRVRTPARQCAVQQAPVKAPARAPSAAKVWVGERGVQLLTTDGWRRLARKVGRQFRLLPPAARRGSAAVRPGEAQQRPRGDDVALPPEVCGPPLSDDEMVENVQPSAISLGFSAVGNMPKDAERILQVRLRDFEAPMSGAFYLVEQMEELESFFRSGRNNSCVTRTGPISWRNARTTSLTTRSGKLLESAPAGHARALRDHTWQRRFTDVFRTAGLQSPSQPDIKAR